MHGCRTKIYIIWEEWEYAGMNDGEQKSDLKEGEGD